MQTIARFYEPWKAHVVRGRLWAEDIPAFVAFEYHVGNAWLEAIALGGVRLQVQNGFEDEARAVLRQAEAGAFREELEYEFGPLQEVRCPHCGASDYCKARPVAVTVLAALLAWLTLFGDPARWPHSALPRLQNRVAARGGHYDARIALSFWPVSSRSAPRTMTRSPAAMGPRTSTIAPSSEPVSTATRWAWSFLSTLKT